MSRHLLPILMLLIYVTPTIGGNYGSILTGGADTDTVAVVVEADSVLGALGKLWRPSIAVQGLGSALHPDGVSLMSDSAMVYWARDIDWLEGTHQITIWGWDNDLEKYGVMIDSIADAGTEDQLMVCLVGVHETNVDSSYYSGGWTLGGNAHAYPPKPAFYDEYKLMQYDTMKYLVIAGDSVQNTYLFKDADYHATLGLGDDIWFSFWYGIGGSDAFQFRGSQTHLDTTWSLTWQAADSLEGVYADTISIKLGGFGCGSGVLDAWRAGGSQDSLFIFSNANSIPVDWGFYQYRAPAPWALSVDGVQNRGPLFKLAMANAGLDTTGVPVFACAWRSQDHVLGMVNSRGDSLGNKVEVQCEIEAALVPARIADMAAINQTYQWHEYIQDTNLAGESPLFSGSIGAMTAGVEALGFMGLKKAHWNTMKMLAKLGAQQLYSTSDYAQYGGDPPDMTVNVVAAADTISDIIQVLVWSYIDPSRYDGVVVSGPDPANRTDYNYLYDYIEADIGSDTIFVSVSINDLGSDYAQTSLQQWTIDKYTSNAFEYREAICWALGLAGCTGSYPDSTFTLQQVNAWTSTTSPAVYGSPSVDLERTTTQDVIAIDDYNVTLGMLPYSVVMMTLQGFDGVPSPGDSEMTGAVVGRAPILSHRRHN